MRDQVQEIKSRLDIVDIVSDYVELKKTGANHKGLCPFHGEKTPSFMVNQDKQIFHCFGCNEGGDIYSFLQKIEGIDFSESLRILAKRAGIILTRTNPEHYKKKNKAIDILNLSVQYYYQSLLKSTKGEIAREYLKQRKVTNTTIDDFRLGYSPPQWDALYTFLLSRGFKEQEIFDAGVIVQKEKGGYYDRFRNRAMFPIRDVNGDYIGFGARKLDENEGGGKYINSPQSSIYDKSRVIFGLYEAKKSIKENDFVIVVEGYLDVLSNQQVGIKHVVASSGTAFADTQIQLLKRYTKNIYYCFDNDSAGMQALYRACIAGYIHDMNVKVIHIPVEYGKDPDDCIHNDLSKWQECITLAQDGIVYFIVLSTKGLGGIDISTKKTRIDRLLNLIKYIKNPIERAHWLNELARAFGEDLHIIQEQFTVIDKEKSSSVAKRALVSSSKTDMLPDAKKAILLENTALQRIYAELFRYYIFYPELFKNELNKDHFIDEGYRELYNFLSIYYTNRGNVLPVNDKGNFAYEEFVYTFAQDVFSKDGLLSLFNTWYLKAGSLGSVTSHENEYNHLIRKIKKSFIKNKLSQVSQALGTQRDPDKISELTKLSQDLITQYKNL